MLLEGYLMKLKTYPEDEIKIIVTATAKSVLAPSWKLLMDFKRKVDLDKQNGLNDLEARKKHWDKYRETFLWELAQNPETIKEMRRIKELAKTKNVRLICYEKEFPCHRFILMELITEMPEKLLKDLEKLENDN